MEGKGRREGGEDRWEGKEGGGKKRWKCRMAGMWGEVGREEMERGG